MAKQVAADDDVAQPRTETETETVLGQVEGLLPARPSTHTHNTYRGEGEGEGENNQSADLPASPLDLLWWTLPSCRRLSLSLSFFLSFKSGRERERERKGPFLPPPLLSRAASL